MVTSVNKIRMEVKLPTGQLERAVALPETTETNIKIEVNPDPSINVPPQLPPPPIDNDEPPKKRHKTAAPRLVLKTNNETAQLETNQVLLEIAARMDNAISELIGHTDALSDQSKKKELKRQEAIKTIRESIVPMLYIASRFMHDTGMSFAPFGGTRTLHHRNETQKRKDVVDKTSDKSPALQMIDDFVKNSVVEIPQHLTKSTSAQSTGQDNVHEGNDNVHGGEDTLTIALLRPKNGTEYTRSEALMAAKYYEKGKERGMAIRAMVEKGFAPASTKTIYRLIQADDEGYPIVDDSWSGPGRPHKVPDKSFAAARGTSTVGKLFGQDLVKVTIKRKRSTKQSEKSTEVTEKPNKATETNQKPAAKLPASKTALPKPKDKTTVSPKIINFPLPEPREGKRYKKSECVEIAREYPKGSPLRRTAIEAMLYRGYVPSSMKTVYRLLARDEKGLNIIDNDWADRGSPPLLTNDEVDKIIQVLKQEDGRIYGKADVEQLLVNAAREKMWKQGENPEETTIRFSSTSVRNYCTMFKSKLSSVYWKD